MPVTINHLVTVYNGGDIIVEREALNASPARLFEAVRLAYFHWDEDPFHFSEYTSGKTITLEEYLSLKREYEIARAGRSAKRNHTSVRRRDFNANRDRLVLVMLEANIPYTCASVGCEITENLTVDHILPLSRGGDDTLDNLQFLCRSHNSAKGDNLDH
jgi:5-methylcytosine-specific restriction endonuclease McrA